MIGELWSDEKIALLKELWGLDLTGRQIAEIMALKKMPSEPNAIYKKAQRLGLPARTSPIINAPKGRPKAPTKQERNTALHAPVSSPATIQARPEEEPTNRAPKYEINDGCCWPFGDPKKPDFHFCGKPRIEKNYCSFHEKRAYNRPF